MSVDAAVENGRVVVHIGLPKTATTTLQTDFFPNVQSSHIRYLGVRQPRDTQTQDLTYSTFIDSINSGEVSECREMFRDLLSVKKTVVLSDEMITVSHNGITWREKLTNLSTILKGFDYVIVFTVREPVSAMFSYYVEINRHASENLSDLVSFAMCDERMEIYHYGKLIQELLERFDRDKIVAIKFEDIIDGRLDALSGLLDITIDTDNKQLFQARNKRVDTETYVYSGRNLTIIDIIKIILRGLKINESSLALKIKAKYSGLILRLNRLVITRQKIYKLSEDERIKISSLTEKENRQLERLFSIKY